jgi:hypothetical protein
MVSFSARLLCSVCLCGTLFGCGSGEQISAVEPSIPEERLVEVLKDVQLAEAAAMQCSPAKRDSAIGAYYAVIFRLHGIGREEFEQSLSALLADPGRSARVFGRVSERLIEEEAQKED